MTNFPRIALILLVVLLGTPATSNAQDGQFRLSDWLLAHPPTADDYPLGIMWQTPEEEASQIRLRSELLFSLSDFDPEVTANSDALKRLHDWIYSLPVTGRAPVALADARWLQANPGRDPVLRPAHSIILPKRPRTVTVITSAGALCKTNHASGYVATDYVYACNPSGSQQLDWIWIVQPDGQIQRFGVAAWNLEAHKEPAPGAWIWAPPRNSGWADKLSYQLVSFLATQGVAPDDPSDQITTVDNLTLSPSAIITSSATRVTASDFGSIGLIQTPTARMREEGDLATHLNTSYPYTHFNVFFQPFSWMEAGFRYTDISNRLYGTDIAGTQTYKDKSIDAKVRLWNESAYLPELAVGLRDLAGTGLFSGEYLVANKRTGNFDWSLGMGWGNLGARGDVSNPLGQLNSNFNIRATDIGQGGMPGIKSYFRGPAALFGGVQYQTPWEPLILKLEYDGNNYQHQGLDDNLPQSSPWNLSAVYRLAPWLDFNFGIERGDTTVLGMTFHSSLSKISMPKLSNPPAVAVAESFPRQMPNWATTSRDVSLQTNWAVHSIVQNGHELIITVDDAGAGYWRENLDRGIAVLHRDAPASIDRFTFAYRDHGVEVSEHHVDRNAWVAQRTQALPPSQQLETVFATAPSAPAKETQLPLYHGHPAMLEAKPAINLNYSLGGPDAFFLYQLAATEKATLKLSDNLWLEGTVQLGLLDNYNLFRYDAPSNLPRVRTLIREYKTSSAFTMPNLQLTHVAQLSENNFLSLYGGYLEDMYAGVGGEWLYRPYANRWAFGVDVNSVQQRGFMENFELLDYRVVTGHATLYWDTGWNNIQANLSAGRYLAQDTGFTIELNRYFQNGVTVGAGFTKTNVSAEQFGEGSFDKWLYLSIPYDALYTRSSRSTAYVIWKPLTRDGGAKLSRAVNLYSITQTRDDRTLFYKASPPPNEYLIPEDQRENWRVPK